MQAPVPWVNTLRPVVRKQIYNQQVASYPLCWRRSQTSGAEQFEKELLAHEEKVQTKDDVLHELGWKAVTPFSENSLLPTVEHRRLRPQFLTQIRNWHLVQKGVALRWPPFGGVVPALFSHTFSSLS